MPFVGNDLAPAFSSVLGFIPLFRSNNPTGYSMLSGGIVLAVMVVAGDHRHHLRGAGRPCRAGCARRRWRWARTRWQTIKHVVLRKAAPGVLAAVVLGFSRAFGETMAVLMVVGNVAKMPHSIFDPAYPLTALIANNYGEMMSDPAVRRGAAGRGADPAASSC